MTVIARQPRKLTIDQFLAFYDTRPDEEQWQLIDGVALLMTPPFLTHQVIATNLQGLLNEAIGRSGAPLRAYQRIGIELPEFPHYRPEPDVAVIDKAFPPDRRYVDRFYLAAEVISHSDEDRVDVKRDYYRSHENNRAILLIRQDRQELEVDRRIGEAWRTQLLKGPEDTLTLPDFGLSCGVDALYQDTFLAAR